MSLSKYLAGCSNLRIITFMMPMKAVYGMAVNFNVVS